MIYIHMYINEKMMLCEPWGGRGHGGALYGSFLVHIKCKMKTNTGWDVHARRDVRNSVLCRSATVYAYIMIHVEHMCYVIK